MQLIKLVNITFVLSFLLSSACADSLVPIKGEGDVLVSKDGKPFLTCYDFEKLFEELLQKHPYGAILRQIEEIDRKYCKGLVSQLVIDEWSYENNIEKTQEFQNQLKNLTQMLRAKFFQIKYPATVSFSEIKAFYDENKEDMPEEILSRGGINVVGVLFFTKADALAFLEKVKNTKKSLRELAKDNNISRRFHDFKIVNANSVCIDSVLRDKIIGLKKIPMPVLIEADNKYWVIHAISKEEGQKDCSFEATKAAIEKYLIAQKQEDAMEDAIEKLIKYYKIVISEEYFNKKCTKGADIKK